MCEEKKSENHQNYLNTNFLVHFQLGTISSVKNPAFEPILFLNNRAYCALLFKPKFKKIGFLEKK